MLTVCELSGNCAGLKAECFPGRTLLRAMRNLAGLERLAANAAAIDTKQPLQPMPDGFHFFLLWIVIHQLHMRMHLSQLLRTLTPAPGTDKLPEVMR